MKKYETPIIKITELKQDDVVMTLSVADVINSDQFKTFTLKS